MIESAFVYVVAGGSLAYVVAFSIALPIIAIDAWRNRHQPRNRYTSNPGPR